jgi:hypothetical protein
MNCRDPNLAEALSDPLVRAVMAADGVDPRKLAAELRAIAARLNLYERSHVATRARSSTCPPATPMACGTPAGPCAGRLSPPIPAESSGAFFIPPPKGEGGERSEPGGGGFI